MTHREILTSLLEGKKIFDKIWYNTKYIHLSGENIIDNSSHIWSIASISDECELYSETLYSLEDEDEDEDEEEEEEEEEEDHPTDYDREMRIAYFGTTQIF